MNKKHLKLNKKQLKLNKKQRKKKKTTYKLVIYPHVFYSKKKHVFFSYNKKRAVYYSLATLTSAQVFNQFRPLLKK